MQAFDSSFMCHASLWSCGLELT